MHQGNGTPCTLTLVIVSTLISLQLTEVTSLVHVIRACINCDKLQEAESKLEVLRQNGSDEGEYVLLKTLLLRKQGKIQEALDFLEKSTFCSTLEAFLLLGDFYWDLKQWDKSLVPYLKVVYTKLIRKYYNELMI